MHGGVIRFPTSCLYMFMWQLNKYLAVENYLFMSHLLGAVVLTYLVYYIQIGGYLIDISKLGLPSELINAVFNLDIISGNRFEGRLLYEQMEPLLATTKRLWLMALV